ncbi:hypothetical protein Tco_0393915 [Tanacetum coccineum]
MDLHSTKSLCNVITRMLLLFAVTTSNTQDPSTSMSDITLSKSKWKMVWLSSTSSEHNICWQTSSPKHWQEKDLNFYSTSLGCRTCLRKHLEVLQKKMKSDSSTSSYILWHMGVGYVGMVMGLEWSEMWGRGEMVMGVKAGKVGPKLGRSCREVLGTVVGMGTGVCCICVTRGVGGGGRVVADTRGGSTIVVTRTSTSKVALVLRVNTESIHVSGLGLSMLETKPDDTE